MVILIDIFSQCQKKNMRELNSKTKEELITEFKELLKKYNSLKALTDKNITESKSDENQLKYFENQNTIILQSAGEGILGIDANGNHTFVNPMAAHLLGYEISEMLGKNSHNLWHHSSSNGDYSPCEECPIHETLRDGKKHQGESYLIRKDGTGFYVDFTCVPIYENGIITGAVVTFFDITQRKQSQDLIFKLKQAVETSGEVIFITDLTGIITYINPEFTNVYGYSSEEVIGKVTPRILKSGVVNALDYKYFWDTLLNNQVVNCEIINKTKDGRLLTIEESANPILNEQNEIVGFLAIQHNITERKQVEEELKVSKDQLRNFASHIQNIREEEKISLAREIHDSLGQILISLKINLGMFKRKVSNENETIQLYEIIYEIDQLIKQVDNVNKSVRRIMNGLRPEQLELLGFVEAAEVHLHDFEEIHHIACRFESEILGPIINPEQSLMLFRILQESLNNIVKHANASLVTVKLTNSTGKLIMEIVDNGIGFDENKKIRQDSYGLIGMKERVILLDGIFEIRSVVDNGTMVRVEIPYET